MSPLFWQHFLAGELSPNKSRAFLETLGTSLDPLPALLVWPGLSREERKRIENARLDRFETALSKGVVLADPASYPESLTEIQHAPPALFCWGKLESWHQPKVAIVGTRGASAYGRAAALKFAEHLAASGVTVVSGGALGIDAAAHEGAIKAGGSTIAVLGHGIDSVFPSSHGELFKRIREKGMLVSQFAVGSPSLSHHFIHRNQVIAALADVTLVIEAPEKSGALRTAGAANDLGRSVFVVPGSIDRDGFRGSHALIRDGAILADHPDQILESMGIEPRPLSSQAAPELASEENQILAALDSNPKTAESLAVETGLEPQELNSYLTLLEIEGHIIREGAGFIIAP